MTVKNTKERKNKKIQKMKKTLKDLRVVEMKRSLFDSNKPVYKFSQKGKLLIKLPIGSLIYIGQTVRRIEGHYAICAIWKGKEKIDETRKVFIWRQ